MDVSEYSDCTVTATTVEATSGSQWSVRFEDDGTSFSRAADGSPDFTIEINATAQYSGSDFTFIDAEFIQTMRTRDCMPDNYNDYVNMDPVSKQWFNALVISEVANQMNQLRIGTLNTSKSSMDDNYIKLNYTLSTSYRQQFENAFKESLNNSNKNLKTNAGKNKYILKVSDKSYYMKKL